MWNIFYIHNIIIQWLCIVLYNNYVELHILDVPMCWFGNLLILPLWQYADVLIYWHYYMLMCHSAILLIHKCADENISGCADVLKCPFVNVSMCDYVGILTLWYAGELQSTSPDVPHTDSNTAIRHTTTTNDVTSITGVTIINWNIRTLCTFCVHCVHSIWECPLVLQTI